MGLLSSPYDFHSLLLLSASRPSNASPTSLSSSLSEVALFNIMLQRKSFTTLPNTLPDCGRSQNLQWNHYDWWWHPVGPTLMFNLIYDIPDHTYKLAIVPIRVTMSILEGWRHQQWGMHYLNRLTQWSIMKRLPIFLSHVSYFQLYNSTVSIWARYLNNDL
jgi:hypothetical protein